MLLGLAHEVALELGPQRVVAFEQGEIDGDGLAHHAVLEVIGDAFAIARVGDPLGEGRQVVLLVRHLDVGDQLAALADQVQASAQQIARARMPAGYT